MAYKAIKAMFMPISNTGLKSPFSAILLDFGSTYTKVVCVDLNARRVVLSDKYPSTVLRQFFVPNVTHFPVDFAAPSFDTVQFMLQ